MTLTWINIGSGTIAWGMATLFASGGIKVVSEMENVEQTFVQANQSIVLTIVPILTVVGFFIFGILNVRRQRLNAQEVMRHNKAMEANEATPES